MGNIKSFCCRDNVSELDDREERARILSDNNGSTGSLCNNSSNPSQDDLSYGSMNNGEGGAGCRSAGGSKTQEQSALDKIYQKLAANVIDVAPGESMVIQPAEFIERQKAYQARLNQIKNAPPLRSSASKVPRNLNNTLLDALSGNTSRLNASAVGANLTALNNQLNTTSATTSTSNISTNYSLNAGVGGTSNFTNTTTMSNNTSGGPSGGSPQHLSVKADKPRVEYEPISMEEIQLINEISDRTVKAIKNFKVVSSEPVVTCFQP